MLELMSYLIINLPDRTHIVFEKIKIGIQGSDAIQFSVYNKDNGKAYAHIFTYEEIQHGDLQTMKLELHRALEESMKEMKL